MDAANMQIHTQLFELHPASGGEVWADERFLDGVQAHLSLWPLEPRRPWSRSLACLPNR